VATAAKGTRGYVAPEVCDGAAASFQSDAFALGVTIDEVVELLLPDAAHRPRPLVKMLAALTLTSPSERLSVNQALHHSYFVRLVADEKLPCVICLEEQPRTAGIVCASDHFTCGGCFAQHIAAAAAEEPGVRRLREGRVCCPKAPRECAAGEFSDEQIATHGGGVAYGAYMRSRVELIEQRIVAEQEAVHTHRFEEELTKLRAMDERTRFMHLARIDLQEQKLTLRCPRKECAQPFDDFDGCCALTCSKCSVQFCAWCFWAPPAMLHGLVPRDAAGRATMDQDVHQHVSECAARPPAAVAHDPFFTPNPIVQAHWRTLKEQRVREELARDTYDAESRRVLLDWVMGHLRE
jgi:serine/threonine protein kinase